MFFQSDDIDNHTYNLFENHDIVVIEVGLSEADYVVSENDGSVHVCIQLMQGSRCRRPVVIRVHTVQCDPGAAGKSL